MQKVLIVGGGILEHALAWKLQRSSKAKVYVAPGNAGIAQIVECVKIEESNHRRLIQFAKQEKIDLTIIGPYRLISEGIADHFYEEKLQIFAPRSREAEIGTRRVVAKELMRHYSIPTPYYHTFENIDGVLTFCKHARFPMVIKIDGIALAGTAVCHSMDDVTHYLDKTMKEKIFGEAGERVLIEDFIPGQIISTTILMNKTTIIPFPHCQIIRKLEYENKIPVRLGAFCPATCLTKRMTHQIEREIIVPLVHAINRQYQGHTRFLTIDIVIGEKGPRVLDFKIQWSDILAQLLLSSFTGDFLKLVTYTLNGYPERAPLEWESKPVIGVVVMKDKRISKDVLMPDFSGVELNDSTHIFCGKTQKRNGKTYAISDRILGITSCESTLEASLDNIRKALSQLDLPGDVFYLTTLD